MTSLFETSQIHNYTIDPNIHHTNKNIRYKFYATSQTHYSVLNYDKDFVCFDDNECRKYRSVICSYPEKQVLCFSPSKSVPYTHFRHTEKTNITELTQGLMVNLFYDGRIDSWELATKSAVSCKYGGKYNANNFTFRDMFITALAGNPEKALNENPIIGLLPKWCSFSFVMSVQDEPRLTLVAVFIIQKLNVLMLPSNIYKEWSIFKSIDGLISFPKEYDKIPDTDTKRGYMLTNYETGERTKWFHNEYIKQKRIDKIKPATQYQYLCLKRVNKVFGYLDYFPKQKYNFALLQNQYDEYVDKVHHYYVEHFVKKNISWHDIPSKFKNTIYKIHHSIHIKGLSQNMRIVITKHIVRDWLNKKAPMEVANILNYKDM